MFTPPKPWNPDRFRSVITSLEDQTIIEQTAIPWCTEHDVTMIPDEPSCDARYNENPCVLSVGGPDHRWWQDVVTG